MTSSAVRRVVAIALVLCTASLQVGAPASAAGNALFSGRVVEADGGTPRPGVVVTLVDVAAKRSYESKPTDEQGDFSIDTAPAATYGVLAKTEEGTYLAAEELALQEGANKPVMLALKTGAQPTLAPGQGGGGLDDWAEGLIAGLLLILAYLLLDDVSEKVASDPIPL